MADAKRDNNSIPTLLAVSNVDGVTPVVLWADPTTHRLLVDLPAGGTSIAIGSTVISGGTTGRLLYDSATVVGETTNIYTDATSIGFGTTAPTHAATFASTSTGIALYNTADQVTNYERLVINVAANVFGIIAGAGGTGTVRDISLASGSSVFAVRTSGVGGGIFEAARTGTSANNLFAITGTAHTGTAFIALTVSSGFASTSGVQSSVVLNPIVNQTTTAGYTILKINPTLTAVGTGAQLLQDWQGGGTSIASFSGVGFNAATALVSGASAVYNGFNFPAQTVVVSGSTNITTATGVNKVVLGIPTYSAASALTITNAATLYIAGAPAGGGAGPATITNAYSIWVDAGDVRFDGNVVIYGVTSTGATGTGAFVFATSPTLVTPVLGVATATSINKVALTAPATSATLTIADGKTLTASNSITLAGTDATVMTFPSTSATIARIDAGQTFTGVNTFTSPKIITQISDTNGNASISIVATASAVNSLQITNAATGVTGPLLKPVGETNVDLRLGGLGTGKVAMQSAVNHGAFTAYFTETDNGNSGTADTIDWTLSNKQKSTLTGNCTFTFTAPAGPCSLILKLVQDGTGSRTVTWPAAVHWSGGTAPTLTTTLNKVDIISFYYDGTTYFGNSSLNFTA